MRFQVLYDENDWFFEVFFGFLETRSVKKNLRNFKYIFFIGQNCPAFERFP